MGHMFELLDKGIEAQGNNGLPVFVRLDYAGSAYPCRQSPFRVLVRT